MESQANIRILKAVVIVLGLLIVISIGVIAVTVFRRLSDTGPPPARLTTAPASVPSNGAGETNGERSAGAPLPVFGERRVELPQGARLVETRITGDRMFLRARLLGGNEVWIVLSLLTGQQLGSFELIAE